MASHLTRSSQYRRFDVQLLEPRRLLTLPIGGWVGSYFPGGLEAVPPDQVRHDAIIAFDWGFYSPIDGAAPSNGFSARWESTLRSDHSAVHQLILRLNPQDGIRVHVEERVLLDAWDGAGESQLTVDVPLAADTAVPIRVEYTDRAEAAELWLGWTSPELPVEVIGPEWTPLTADLREKLDQVAPRGMLFEHLPTDDPDYLDQGPVDRQEVVAGQRLDSLDVAPNADQHPAQRTRGYLVPPVSGQYRFRISGGSASRLLLADDAAPELARVVALTSKASSPGQWDVQAEQISEPVPLLAGVHYYFETRQTSTESYGGLRVEWMLQSTDEPVWGAIPNEALRPFVGEVSLRAVRSSVNDDDPNAKLVFEVARNEDFGRDLDVRLAFGGSAAADIDYLGRSHAVTIPAGKRAARVELTIVDDQHPEQREDIAIRLPPSPEYALASPVRSRTTLTISGNELRDGRSMLPDDPLLLANIDQLIGGSNATYSNRQAANEGGLVTGRVLTVETLDVPANPWGIRARWIYSLPLAAGEVFLADFYYRAAAADARASFVVESYDGEYTKWVNHEFVAQPVWQRLRLPFRLAQGVPADNLRMEFRFGFETGVFEVAQANVVRFFPGEEGATQVLPLSAVRLDQVDATAGSGVYADFSNRTTTADENVPFDDVLRVDVHTAGENLWSIRPIWRNRAVLSAGTPVMADVWLRSDHAPFETQLRFERGSAPYVSSLQHPISVTSNWVRYQVPFFVVEPYDLEQARFDIRFGFSQGVIEIGDLQLWSGEPLPDLDQLPRAVASFAERELSDPWRWDAENDVLENRRSVLEVQVIDAAGNPVPSVPIQVRQQEHDFGFGNILKSSWLSDLEGGMGSDPQSQRYQAIASRLFNAVTLEDALRWRAWESYPNRAVDAVQWVNQHTHTERGHYVAWGGLNQLPASEYEQYERLRTELGQQAASDYLRDILFAHILDKTMALSGEVSDQDRPMIGQWDVVNHPILFDEVWRLLGTETIGEIYQLVRGTVHPDTRLDINEGAILREVNGDRTQPYYDLIRDLLEGGNPVEGIGFMSHFQSASVPSPTQMQSTLDYFATLGLPLQITEFDVDRLAFDDQTQADFTEDFFLTVFAHPQVAGTVSWGFWENAHWRSDEGAHWYDRDWQALPNADIWIDLVRRHWWSHSDGSTRADGTYRTMVFDGTHQIATMAGGAVFETTVAVDAAMGVHQLEVNFPPELQHLRTASVVERMSVVLDENLLLVTDRDHRPEQVYFEVLSSPAAGSLWLDGAQLGVGATFTQADISGGKLRYEHVGLAECPDFDSFQLGAGDAGGQVVDGVLHIGLQVDTSYPWHNHPSPLDVDHDGRVAPIDALLVINTLNRHGARPLEGDRSRPLTAPFFDTSRDDYVSSLDALLVINWLNRNVGEGERDVMQAIVLRADEPCPEDLLCWLQTGISTLHAGAGQLVDKATGDQVAK